jgi:hypothetical protein
MAPAIRCGCLGTGRVPGSRYRNVSHCVSRSGQGTDLAAGDQLLPGRRRAVEASRSDLLFGDSGPLADIDTWLTAPFHGIGMLRSGLHRVAFAHGFGDAGLDVLGGLGFGKADPKPILFPGNNVTTNLTSYAGALCLVDQFTYHSTDPIYGPTGKAILVGDHAVLLFPSGDLKPGGYHVTVYDGAKITYRWTFKVKL